MSLGLAAGGGFALWTAFPGALSEGGWWPGAVLGVTALCLATRGRGAVTGFGSGLVLGLAFLIPHLAWSGTFVGVVPWMALATLCALFYAVLGAAMPFLQRTHAAVSPLVIAGGWVAIEAARARVPFGGFPWARLVFSQADAPTLSWAGVAGAASVTFVVALAGALLALGLVKCVHQLQKQRSSEPSTAARWPALVPVVAAVAVLASGAVLPRPSAAQEGTVNVAAVQGNTPRAGLDFNAERRAVLDNHVAATSALAAAVQAGQATAPDLVLWPENSSDIDPYRDDQAAAAIEGAARQVGAPLLIGAVLDGPGRYLSNAGLVITPQEGLAGAVDDPDRNYIKRRPAPFAEYMPYRSFFRTFSDKVDLVRRDFLPGQRGGSVVLGGVRVGDVICFEVAFDDLVRDSVRSGAQMLVVQTNNATFGYSDEAVQQLAMSRVRAVETGRTVVQISTVGVSSIIAPDGSAPERTTLFTQDVLQADVALRSEQTLATRLGSLPEWLMASTVLLPLAMRLRARVRARTSQGREVSAVGAAGREERG
ncbi:apolipoprotein N-acyltransferase [Kineococcus rubinsiae]|uniref:apolipoprotein N-acyltransferase n=1 Tax=Kineococcus rubinsiae TaxID=2609562 RepID=UPI0014322B04|nr:apolipoprotein N-acyltransferase [Kineococcus rubinsiae]NIZ93159.1 apolipoprotein N-acyltransferase [Kineococcus rubinsiae]